MAVYKKEAQNTLNLFLFYIESQQAKAIGQKQFLIVE